jgi:hypothetical protein
MVFPPSMQTWYSFLKLRQGPYSFGAGRIGTRFNLTPEHPDSPRPHTLNRHASLLEHLPTCVLYSIPAVSSQSTIQDSSLFVKDQTYFYKRVLILALELGAVNNFVEIPFEHLL